MQEKSGPGLLDVPEAQTGEPHEEETMVQSAVQSEARHPSGDVAYQIAIVLAALLLIATVVLL